MAFSRGWNSLQASVLAKGKSLEGCPLLAYINNVRDWLPWRSSLHCHRRQAGVPDVEGIYLYACPTLKMPPKDKTDCLSFAISTYLEISSRRGFACHPVSNLIFYGNWPDGKISSVLYSACWRLSFITFGVENWNFTPFGARLLHLPEMTLSVLSWIILPGEPQIPTTNIRCVTWYIVLGVCLNRVCLKGKIKHLRVPVKNLVNKRNQWRAPLWWSGSL